MSTDVQKPNIKTFKFSVQVRENVKEEYGTPIVAIFNKLVFQFRVHFTSIQRINLCTIYFSLVQLPILHSTLNTPWYPSMWLLRFNLFSFKSRFCVQLFYVVQRDLFSWKIYCTAVDRNKLFLSLHSLLAGLHNPPFWKTTSCFQHKWVARLFRSCRLAAGKLQSLWKRL